MTQDIQETVDLEGLLLQKRTRESECDSGTDPSDNRLRVPAGGSEAAVAVGNRRCVGVGLTPRAHVSAGIRRGSKHVDLKRTCSTDRINQEVMRHRVRIVRKIVKHPIKLQKLFV